MVYLEKHLKKYPKMELVDIVKLYFQGILGPAHLNMNYETSLTYMMEELKEITIYEQEMIEEISTDYVRVYLYPYYEKYHNFSMLALAFVNSCKEKTNINEFILAIENLKNKENQAILTEYLKSENYLVSHSQTYKKMYHPHYRVIHKKYLNF